MSTKGLQAGKFIGAIAKICGGGGGRDQTSLKLVDAIRVSYQKL